MPPRHFVHYSSRGTSLNAATLLLMFIGTMVMVLASYTLFHCDIHHHILEEHAHHDSVEGAMGLHARRKVTDVILDQHARAMNSMQDAKAMCHIDPNNEYHGDVVTWGNGHSMDTAEACCASCRQKSGCNVWVWCGRPEGCGTGSNLRPFKECWHKKNTLDYVMQNFGKGHSGITWTAGAVYSTEELADWEKRADQARAVEAERLRKLRDDPELPLVWMDVALRGKKLGRIEMVLFVKEAPRAAENLRQLCSGERLPPYTFKGSYFYRIIDRFIDQTGAQADGIFGGEFRDDPGGLKLRHDHKGFLSMANMGPNTNGGHFSIIMGPAHHLDGSYTIFGEVVSGIEVTDEVNKLAQGQPNNEMLNSKDAQIIDVGQTRPGTHIMTPEFMAIIASEFQRVKYNKYLDGTTRARLAALRNNKELPLVYFEVSIKGEYKGRIEMVLFVKEAPLQAENFRALCTGEKGVAPPGTMGAGQNMSYTGATFYRIIDRFIDQAGPATGSVFGGEFRDDPGGLRLTHDHKGLLSAAHHGANTNSGHFSIIMAPAHHLDGKYTIFGEVVDGLYIADEINKLAGGKEVLGSKDALILESGEVRRGSYALSKEYLDAVEAERKRVQGQ